MARVRATHMRTVYQYRDAAGHRLPAQKEDWETTWSMLADCPKCPEPVECDHECHRYCPRCGVRL